MKAKYILPILAIHALTSCVEKCKSWGDYKLGDGYSLMAGDGRNETILILCTSDTECCHAGIELVPRNVSEVASDSNWIVARTNSGNKVGYWVIRKIVDFPVAMWDSSRIELIKENVHGPLEYDDYLEWVDGNGIVLDMEKVEWY